MQRETLGSRLGFLLLSAGCAVGLGNVWKFPFVCGQNGGAVFLLLYLFFLALLAVPVLTMEFSIGRASQKSPALMYKQLEKPGSKWHWHGIACVAGMTILMMFYSVVAGWLLIYFLKFARGSLLGLTPAQVGEAFGALVANPVPQIGAMAAVVILGFLVCSFSLRSGLERVTKVMMLILFALLAVLAVHSMLLPGGAKGLEFYLRPNLEPISTWRGFLHVSLAAMTHSFFTLSLGVGSMAIFGSYIGRDHSLYGESVTVAALDTFVAVTAGLVIFPACFAFDVAPNAGPSLIFVTLPNVFNDMAHGHLWGTVFFVFMTFAAFSTVIAVFEGILASVMDLTGWGRRKGSLICCIAMILLSVPCALGFNVWSGFQPFGEGSNILDLEDFVVSYLLLPIGALVFATFCAARFGWGWEKFVAEANQGRGLRICPWMRPWLSIAVPLLIALVLVLGLIERLTPAK